MFRETRNNCINENYLGSKMNHSTLHTTLQRVRVVKIGKRRREVKVVSAEENGISSASKTYRNLGLEYKKKGKSR